MAVDSYARDLAAAALAKGGGSSNYATLDGNNTFEGDQTFNGTVIVNGELKEHNVETELPSGDLETNKESNVPLYEHYGFELKETALVPKSNVTHYSMVRAPKIPNKEGEEKSNV